MNNKVVRGSDMPGLLFYLGGLDAVLAKVRATAERVDVLAEHLARSGGRNGGRDGGRGR
ncbi:hypothetical protein [Yinghuangia sp. YIM S10712]|uniref:hypothetical protein n=1 Tax=Yinghuangia sp. YIM S10712 TaxID=3436930 RepID=UPI003F53B1AD